MGGEQLTANPRRCGTCDRCGEQTDRLYTPPILSIPAGEVPSTGAEVTWKSPKCRFTSRFEVVGRDGDRVLAMVPEVSADRPLCWVCYGGSLWPSVIPYVANKPAEFKLNGWHDPIWTAGGAR